MIDVNSFLDSIRKTCHRCGTKIPIGERNDSLVIGSRRVYFHDSCKTEHDLEMSSPQLPRSSSEDTSPPTA